MRLIKQINAWSCQPAAYAMCMDVGIEDVLRVLGHDGSRIEDLEATSVPWLVAGWTPAEMFLAAYRLGFAAIELPAAPLSHNRRPVRGYPRTPAALMSVFAPGTRFVLTVASANYGGVYHCVAHEHPSDVYHDPLHPEPLAFDQIPPIRWITALLRIHHGPVPLDPPAPR